MIVCTLFHQRLDGTPEGQFQEEVYFEPEEEYEGHFASQGKPSYKFSTLSYIYLLYFILKALHYYFILCDISSWVKFP